MPWTGSSTERPNQKEFLPHCHALLLLVHGCTEIERDGFDLCWTLYRCCLFSLSRFLLLLAATHSDPSGRGGHTSANQLGSWMMPKVDEMMHNVSWHLTLDFMVVTSRWLTWKKVSQTHFSWCSHTRNLNKTAVAWHIFHLLVVSNVSWFWLIDSCTLPRNFYLHFWCKITSHIKISEEGNC